MSGEARQIRIERPKRYQQRQTFGRRLRRWGALAGVLVAAGAIVGLLIHDGGQTTGSKASKTPAMAMDMGPAKPADHGSAQYPYAIGDPGVGVVAPTFSLKSTSGGSFDLSTYTGQQQVLLYFMEGLTCQPCWDQIVAIQKQMSDFHKLGIDTIVTITNDPYDQLKQKATDESLSIPVLADADGAVSMRYTALRYGMMMGMNPGHSFILVGKDGRIAWRADYGGAPKYTMYLPPTVLLQDLKAGLGAA